MAKLIIKAIVVLEVVGAAAVLFYFGQVWQPIVLMILSAAVSTILDEE